MIFSVKYRLPINHNLSVFLGILNMETLNKEDILAELLG